MLKEGSYIYLCSVAPQTFRSNKSSKAWIACAHNHNNIQTIPKTIRIPTSHFVSHKSDQICGLLNGNLPYVVTRSECTVLHRDNDVNLVMRRGIAIYTGQECMGILYTCSLTILKLCISKLGVSVISCFKPESSCSSCVDVFMFWDSMDNSIMHNIILQCCH